MKPDSKGKHYLSDELWKANTPETKAVLQGVLAAAKDWPEKVVANNDAGRVLSRATVGT